MYGVAALETPVSTLHTRHYTINERDASYSTYLELTTRLTLLILILIIVTLQTSQVCQRVDHLWYGNDLWGLLAGVG
jgi:hypothetical protein